MNEPDITTLTHLELVSLNDILIRDIIKLKGQVSEDTNLASKEIGNNSLKGLLEMYHNYQTEITRGGIVEGFEKL